MSYSVNVLGPLRKDDPEHHLMIGLFPDCSLQVGDQPAAILQMDALKECLEWRYLPVRIEAVEAKHFLQTVSDRSGCDVPRPAAGVAQPLRLGQIAFAPPQVG